MNGIGEESKASVFIELSGITSFMIDYVDDGYLFAPRDRSRSEGT